MEKNIDISIIIVSFNTKELLLDCLASIEKTLKKHTFEVIVVDNVSTDGTVESVKSMKSKMKNVKLVENDVNEGFSKANNRGVKVAKGKHILFLNADMVIFDDTIDGMLEFVKNDDKIGAATCFLELPNGKLDDASHRGFPTPWNALSHFSGLAAIFPKSKIFAGYSRGFEDITEPHEIDALAGAFMLIPKKIGDEVGWWDEDFFWYGDDLDFCYRLKEKGYKIMFVPQYRALHYKGASGGIKKTSQSISKADSSTRKKAQRARFDAMRIFYRKHYKGKYPAWLNSLVLLGIGFKYRMTRK